MLERNRNADTAKPSHPNGEPERLRKRPAEAETENGSATGEDKPANFKLSKKCRLPAMSGPKREWKPF